MKGRIQRQCARRGLECLASPAKASRGATNAERIRRLTEQFQLDPSKGLGYLGSTIEIPSRTGWHHRRGSADIGSILITSREVAWCHDSSESRAYCLACGQGPSGR